MLTFYEWKSCGSVTQLLGQAILILIFFVAWGLRIEHIFTVILFGILGSYLFLHIWENNLLKLGK